MLNTQPMLILSPKENRKNEMRFIFLPNMEDLKYYYQSSLSHWRGRSHCVDSNVRNELEILPAVQESNDVL